MFLVPQCKEPIEFVLERSYSKESGRSGVSDEGWLQGEEEIWMIETQTREIVLGLALHKLLICTVCHDHLVLSR